MGIIYRACEVLLAILPADEAGRRVFDETLADWRREPHALRGCVSVGRAIAGVAGREVVSASMARFWGHVLAWTTVWAVLGLGLGSLTLEARPMLTAQSAAWAVSGIVFFLPVALLLSSLSRTSPKQVIGLCCTSVITAVLFVGWVAPAAHRLALGRLVDMPLVQQPPSTGAEVIVRMVWPAQPLTYMTGHFAHELPGMVAAGPPGGWSGIWQIGFNVAFVALCALMPVVAFTLTGRATRTRRVAVVCLMLFVLYRWRVADFIAPDWVLWSFLAPWLPVAVIAAAVLWGSAPRSRATG